MIVIFVLLVLYLYINICFFDFISYMLGDEGVGSLFVYLKVKGWIINLIVGLGIEG